MEGKNVTLVIAGGPSDGHRQQVVTENTTVDDIVGEQNLQGYQLSLGQGKPFLSGRDKVYGLIENGGKIYATTIGVNLSRYNE